MKDMNNKVAVVTGAGSGIGRALATELASKGCRLALTDVNQATLVETVELLGLAEDKVKTYIVDSSDRHATEKLAESVMADFGQVDIVINNAGIATMSTIEDTPYDIFEKIINVNMWGMVNGCKSFIPLLKKRTEASLVNISSIFAFIPMPESGPYNMSKYAVYGLNETLMLELKDTPIKMLSVHPGGIKTNIANNAEGMDDKTTKNFNKLLITTPEKAAQCIVKAIAKKKSYLFIGADAKLAHLFKRLSKRLTLKLTNLAHKSLK